VDEKISLDKVPSFTRNFVPADPLGQLVTSLIYIKLLTHIMHQVSSSPSVSRLISTWGGGGRGGEIWVGAHKKNYHGTDQIKKCSVFPKLHFVFWPLPDFVFYLLNTHSLLHLLHSYFGQGSGKSAYKKRLVDAYIYMFTMQILCHWLSIATPQ